MDQGSLHLDQNSIYMFLWTTPSGNGPLANLYFGSAGTVSSASGIIMPLNSKPQNLHHLYDNYRTDFKHIADGPGLVIDAPNASHQDYRISGRTIDLVEKDGLRNPFILSSPAHRD